MPEGDTILRAARTLHRGLAGKTVTRFESALPRLTLVQEDTPITGRTVEQVRAVGKHLLIEFSGGLVLRTHLRMSGQWHLYAVGAAWRRPQSAMRLVVGTAQAVAVGFDIHDAAFHAARTLLRDSPVGKLGPDVLASDFDEHEAARRLRVPPDVEAAVALLDQRRLAGIGNVYKSETLFLCGIDPMVRVSALSDGETRGLVRAARRLMQANTGARAPAMRRTTGRLTPSERFWVYGRKGKPCRTCGGVIESMKLGPGARTTYWCPSCQRPGVRS